MDRYLLIDNIDKGSDSNVGFDISEHRSDTSYVTRSGSTIEDPNAALIVYLYNPETSSYQARAIYTEMPDFQTLDDYLTELSFRADDTTTTEIAVNPNAQSFGAFGDASNFFNVPILSDLIDFLSKNKLPLALVAGAVLVNKFNSK